MKIPDFFKTKYRIVTDKYAGFEVQFRFGWWPFWTQCNNINTHKTVELAEEWCRRKYIDVKVDTFKMEIVKNLEF